MSSEKDSKYINHSAMSSVDRADPDKGLLSDHERVEETAARSR